MEKRQTDLDGLLPQDPRNESEKSAAEELAAKVSINFCCWLGIGLLISFNSFEGALSSSYSVILLNGKRHWIPRKPKSNGSKSLAKDGQDGDGLQLEKIGPFFSCTSAVSSVPL